MLQPAKRQAGGTGSCPCSMGPISGHGGHPCLTPSVMATSPATPATRASAHLYVPATATRRRRRPLAARATWQPSRPRASRWQRRPSAPSAALSSPPHCRRSFSPQVPPSARGAVRHRPNYTDDSTPSPWRAPVADSGCSWTSLVASTCSTVPSTPV